MKFSGSSPRVWAAKATIMVATAPQKTAPELSNSPVYNPLRVNDRVAFGPRRLPSRTADAMQASAASPHAGEPSKPKLLDRLAQALRSRHYSRRIEQPYCHWIRRYIFFHKVRHPAEMGEAEIRRCDTFARWPQPATIRRDGLVFTPDSRGVLGGHSKPCLGCYEDRPKHCYVVMAQEE